MTQRKCTFCNKVKQTEVESMITGPFKVFICQSCVIRYAQHFGLEEVNDDEMAIRKAREATPREIKAHLDEHIIEQDWAKKALSVAIYNHYQRIRSLDGDCQDDGELSEVRLTKGNILMVGPTGVGKTAMAERIAELLDVPFVVKDATTLTSAGYVGEDVESIVRSLWEAADRDVERTERGIVVIDEVDKIARRGAGNGSNGRDVGGEGVQQALLKLIESNQVNIQADMGRMVRNELIQIDTTNILFIFCGAFVGIEQLIQRRMSPGAIGFGAQGSSGKSRDRDFNDLIKYLRTEDLTRYGLIPEFIGRLPVVVYLNSLSSTALRDILWKPKSSLIKQYQRLLTLSNIELEFTDDALDEVVQQAIKRKAGARGLRSVIEGVMLEVMYEAPDLPDDTRCIINAEVVRGERSAIIEDLSA